MDFIAILENISTLFGSVPVPVGITLFSLLLIIFAASIIMDKIEERKKTVATKNSFNQLKDLAIKEQNQVLMPQEVLSSQEAAMSKEKLLGLNELQNNKKIN